MKRAIFFLTLLTSFECLANFPTPWQMGFQESASELQVPIEAVIEREDQFFCGVLNAQNKVETKPIEVGAVNDTNLVVTSGLSEGEQVILNVNEEGVLDLLDLPEDED